LLLPSPSSVDVAIHVFQHAPVTTDIFPLTPLVGVTLSHSDSAVALDVSGLSEGVNFTLPLLARVAEYADVQYECLSWNGTAYSNEGCVATGVKTQMSVQCNCSHLNTILARVRNPCSELCMCIT
jgi:hypothetical protein